MNDKIPFNSWSKERIKRGMKKCTSRRRKYTQDKRVTLISPKLPWWFIREVFWKDEGAESPEELQRVIEDIYKHKVPDDKIFYVHFGDFSDEND